MNLNAILSYIKEQTGVSAELCDYFTGLRESNGVKYFNIILNDRISESKDFEALKRFESKYKTLRFENNGVRRLSVLIVDLNLLKLL